jgi:hypothetical protein
MNVKAIFEFYRCFNTRDGKASMLHLSGWKAIFHNCSHCASLSRSLCRVRASLFDLITRYAIVSSAKNLIVESGPVKMSFM